MPLSRTGEPFERKAVDLFLPFVLSGQPPRLINSRPGVEHVTVTDRGVNCDDPSGTCIWLSFFPGP